MAKKQIDSKVNRLIQEGYNINISKYINEGFEIFKADILNFSGYTLFTFIISIVLSFIPIIGDLANLAIASPLMAGYFIIAHKIKNRENYSFNDFFNGFQNFGPLFLAYLTGSILIILGLFVLIIPGLYLAVGYLFFPMFIVFKNYDFWPSLEASRQLITKKWFHFLLLCLALLGINILGLLALGIGILISIPISYCILYAAFDDMVKVSGNDEEGDQEITKHLID